MIINVAIILEYNFLFNYFVGFFFIENLIKKNCLLK